MADAKITALTAATALTDDDLLVLVDDPAGTPTTKKITVANARKLFGVTSATAALTNSTPNSLSYQQWGTEEAVVDDAVAPASAVVLAWLTGRLSQGAGGADGDRGSLKLQVSFDGGSSFADMGSANTLALFTTTSARGGSVAATGRSTGTVTGDIQVRAMVSDIDTANDTTWTGGIITVLVHA